MALQSAAKGKNQEAFAELITLAEKFADFVKIRRHAHHRSKSIAPMSGLAGGDAVAQMRPAGLKILLPSDAKEVSDNHKAGKTPSSKIIEGAIDEDDEDAGEGLADEEVVLFEDYVEVPVQEASLAPSDSTATPGGPRRFSLHPTHMSHKTAARKSIKEQTENRRSSFATTKTHNDKIEPIAPLPVFKKPDKLPQHLDGTLKVIAVEKRENQSMDRDLIITLTYDEESKVASTAETVKLPMLCSVDVKMAQEFVKGLVPRVFCEMPPIGSGPKDPVLVVADLDAEDEGDNNFGVYFD